MESTPLGTPDPIKAGYATTEFWLSTVSAFFFAAVAAGVFPNTEQWVKVVAIIGGALTAMGYGNARAVIKSAALPMLLLLGIVLGGCQSPNATASAPDLTQVMGLQMGLLTAELSVEDLHARGKMGDKTYIDLRAAELAASKALDAASTAAVNKVPLTEAQQTEIARGFIKTVNDAILLNGGAATQPN